MMFWALATGLALGVLGWPGLWAWAGLLWPLAFARAFTCPPKLSRLLAFGFGLAQGQFVWLISALQPASGRPWPLDWLLLSFGGWVLSLPLVALLWVLARWARRRVKEASALFFWGFPLVYGLHLYLRDYFPLSGLVASSPAALSPVVDLWGPAYRIWGVKGMELALLWSGLLLAWAWHHRRALWAPWALLPLLLVFLSGWLWPPPPAQGPSFEVAYLPWRGIVGTDPPRQRALAEMLVRNAQFPEVPLILWPESALPGNAAEGRALEQLQSKLNPGQSLLFGVNRAELAGDHLNYANAAYLLSAGEFSPQFVAKEYLVPGVETALGGFTIIPRQFTYRSGSPVWFKVNGLSLAPGLCSEQFIEPWYRSREEQAQGYVFLSRWFLFGPLGRELLHNLGRAYAAQTDKPVVQVVNGGLSGPVMARLKGQDLGQWKPEAMGGKALVIGQDSQSPYYRFGPGLLLVAQLLAGLLAFKQLTPARPPVPPDDATANNPPVS
ncbi:MAG: hypothetical protein RRB13_15205 [bacterium]|nr:hypothetical protein [bacterium]